MPDSPIMLMEIARITGWRPEDIVKLPRPLIKQTYQLLSVISWYWTHLVDIGGATGGPRK